MFLKKIVITVTLFFISVTCVYAQCSFRYLNDGNNIHVLTDPSCNNEVLRMLCSSKLNVGKNIVVNDRNEFVLTPNKCFDYENNKKLIVYSKGATNTKHESYFIQLWAGSHMPKNHDFKCSIEKLNVLKIEGKFFVVSNSGSLSKMRKNLISIKKHCPESDAWIRPKKMSWNASILVLDR